jgi:hypothetical protein
MKIGGVSLTAICTTRSTLHHAERLATLFALPALGYGLSIRGALTVNFSPTREPRQFRK